MQLLDAIWAVILVDHPEERELGRFERELLVQRLAEDDVMAWDDRISEIFKLRES